MELCLAVSGSEQGIPPSLPLEATLRRTLKDLWDELHAAREDLERSRQPAPALDE